MTTATGSAAAAPAGEVAALLIDVPGRSFDAVVAFWAAALSADAEAMPGMPGGDEVYVTLRRATAVTDVLVQRIGDDDPSRLHLDVAVPDRAAAVARAAPLGATVRQREASWDVLVDPAGLPLCVGFEDPDDPQVAPRAGGSGYLDAVTVDVGPATVDAEVTFWAALLGASPVPPAAASSSHALRGARAVGGGALGFEVQAVAAGRAEAPGLRVDLSSTDVGGEVERLRALGARHVATSGDRGTLADPAGNHLRVVPAVD